MDDLHEEHARELIEFLERAGMNCGLMTSQGTVFLRSPGAPFTDTPTTFDEGDLKYAIALGLLEKQSVTGSHEWEWYVAKGEHQATRTL
jgi:hypothetical protein